MKSTKKSLKTDLKTFWTWDEWRAGRSALKKITDRVASRTIRRKKSSSDHRLKAAYAGKRGPAFFLKNQCDNTGI